MIPWYCWNREHEHSTEREANWCIDLHDLWQEAVLQLLTYVREDTLERQVNTVLPDEEPSR